LAEAEALYRQILDAVPNEVASLHLLGVLHVQRGDFVEAVRVLGAALRINPRLAAAHVNRGVALERLGRFAAALTSYDRAAALDPDDAGTFYNRGNALKELGRFADAVASFDRALALEANHVGACYNRGNALAALKRFAEAAASYERALALKPDHAGAWLNRGIALHELKRFDESIASHDKALVLKPDHAAALVNRGITLLELGQFDAALASFDRAIALEPELAEAFGGRGNALRGLKRLDEAVASYDRAIALRPDDAAAHSNRADGLRALRRPADALASCERAIALKPDFAEAWINRGIALMEMRRYEDAVASYDRAIALKPDDARAFYNRGIALADLRLFDAALASFEQAIGLKADYADAFDNRGRVLKELKRFGAAAASYDQARALAPNHKYAFGGLADCAIKTCDWAWRDRLSDEVRRRAAGGESILPPFLLLGYCDDAALQLACARNCLLDRLGADRPRLEPGALRRVEKIKVAYLSSDFRLHATSLLAASLFELHDRSRFEVVGVSLGLDDGSDMRARIVAAFDRFIDVTATSDADAARLLNDLQIDIAVDLNGHTDGARPGILALRPAPIQVSYLGFPGTTGADFIDYIIADPIVLPLAEQAHYTERIVHLPGCYQVNDRRRAVSSRAPSREELGLPARAFVFCCFNNNWKITPDIFDVWMRLLQAVEGSVLWLVRDNADAATNLCKEAAARNVDPARLVFAERMAHADHLARHRAADLFLDTLPCNAHTTASDALWTGLPVLTCRGKTFAGRVAASALSAVGLSELVTESLVEYEALALRIATDERLRRSLREKLDRNRITMPLFDTDRFRRHIEAAYVTMWELGQRGEAPRSFSVAAQ